MRRLPLAAGQCRCRAGLRHLAQLGARPGGNCLVKRAQRGQRCALERRAGARRALGRHAQPELAGDGPPPLRVGLVEVHPPAGELADGLAQVERREQLPLEGRHAQRRARCLAERAQRCRALGRLETRGAWLSSTSSAAAAGSNSACRAAAGTPRHAAPAQPRRAAPAAPRRAAPRHTAPAAPAAPRRATPRQRRRAAPAACRRGGGMLGMLGMLGMPGHAQACSACSACSACKQCITRRAA